MTLSWGRGVEGGGERKGQQHCATDGNVNSLLDGKNSELGSGKVFKDASIFLSKSDMQK